jgi:acetylcholinesterase
MFTLSLAIAICVVTLAVNIPTLTLAAAAFIGPQVELDKGTFVGVGNGSINRFLGIPFAKPP